MARSWGSGGYGVTPWGGVMPNRPNLHVREFYSPGVYTFERENLPAESYSTLETIEQFENE